MWGVFCGRVNKCKGICQHPLVANDKSQLNSQEHKQNGKCIGSHDEEECETQTGNKRTCQKKEPAPPWHLVFIVSTNKIFWCQVWGPHLVLSKSLDSAIQANTGKKKIFSLMGNRKWVWPFQEPIQLKRCSAQSAEGKANNRLQPPDPGTHVGPTGLWIRTAWTPSKAQVWVSSNCGTE